MPGGPPPVPPNVKLPPLPPRDGSLLELTFGKLTAQQEWLFESVDILSKKMDEINKHLESQADLWKRLGELENKPPPEPQVVVQERPRTPVKIEMPKIEIPYVPSEEERAEEARRAVRPMLDDEVAKLTKLISANTDRIQTLEEICARSSPWDKMQKYMQELGFLPFGEPEEKDPLKLMGQVFVLFRQGIDMCPKIKDLEDAKDALNLRINSVESNAAADCENRAQKAAAASAKIKDDLEAVDKRVKALEKKNEEDGDVAGGLRDLLLRVDNVEEKRFPRLELRVKKLEDAEHPEAEKTSAPRAKGFLEEISEVDVNDEVRRLRTMVECMEAAMPYETRQTMQYFKENGGAPAGTGGGNGGTGMSGDGASALVSGGGGGGGGAVTGDMRRFQTELLEQLERHKAKSDREHQNMLRNLKSNEKTVEKLESQILDVYKKLPKVLAVLEPLQAQLENFIDLGPMDGPGTGGLIDSTGGPGTGGAPGRPPFGGPPSGGPPSGFAAPIPAQMLGAGAPDAGTEPGADGTGASTSPVLSRPVSQGGLPVSPGHPYHPSIAADPASGYIAGPASQHSSSKASTPPALANRGSATTPPGLANRLPGAANKPGTPILVHPSWAKMPEGAAGTGEGFLAPPKDTTPMAQMGSLTGLIKVALQSTTNEIHLNLHQDMLNFRAELMNGLDGKANKSELIALASRLDAWSQKRSRASADKDRFRNTYSGAQDRSLSPRSDQAADTTKDSLRHSFTAPGGKLGAGATSPTKKTTCHDKCKEPTAPRADKMSQSLSRLPALKS